MSNQNAKYEITTFMEKEDYRKFLYMIIFNNKLQRILLIIVLAGAGSGLWTFYDNLFSVTNFLLIWLLLIAIAFAAIFLRVEYKAFNRMNAVRAGITGTRQDLTFYENYLIAAEDNVKGTNKIKYDRLHQVRETEDYYIIYANASSASMIRKKDIEKEDREGFGTFLKVKLGSRYKSLIRDKRA